MKSKSIPSLLIAALSSVLFGSVSPKPMQLQTLPGSVIRAERLLTSAGCLNCHELNGKAGTRGPDLAIPSKTAGTPALFATSLWNHMPSMLNEIEAIKSCGSRPEAGGCGRSFCLLLLDARYFSPRGSAARGGSLFVEKQCSNCHSEILNTDRKIDFVETWMDSKGPKHPGRANVEPRDGNGFRHVESRDSLAEVV